MTIRKRRRYVGQYVHALQDQHYDLDALYESAANSDEETAIQALIEDEEVTTLLDEPDGRWWRCNANLTFARHEDDRVLVVIGPDKGTVQAVLAGLEDDK